MKISILIAALLLIGCAKPMQYKMICDNWESPWVAWIAVYEGNVKYTHQWKPNINWVYRKMKDGESCREISRYKDEL